MLSLLYLRVKAQRYFVSSSRMFIDTKTLLKIWLNPGLNFRGGSRGRVQVVCTPPEITCSFLIQLVFCKKKKIGLLVLKSRARDECTPS